MRIGMLTGGGDCPGLNAVIRAVVRKGEGVYGARDRRVPPRLARRDRGRDGRPRRRVDARAAPPRRHDPRHVAHEPVQDRRRPGARRSTRSTRERIDALDRDRRRGHARRRGASSATSGVAVVGVPKTIDNDLVGHRLHVRVPHRGADRDRRDRPPAHDGREPRPRDGRRGDGPPRRVDRDLLRDRRRRRHHPRARGAVRHRRGVRADRAPAPPRRELLDRRRGRGRVAEGGHDRRCRAARSTSSATCASAGSAT